MTALALALWLSTPDARAFTGAVHERAAPFAIEGAVVLPRDRREVLLLLGAEQSAWLDEGAVIGGLPAGRDAVALDIDGDGRRELLICGEAGVTATMWERPLAPPVEPGPRVVVPGSCRAIAASGDLVVTAGETVRLWKPQRGQLIAQGELQAPHGERPLLAIDGALLAATGVGATEIVEQSPNGLSSLATGGPVGGLAATPQGWTWSLPERAMLATAAGPIAVRPNPGPIARADLGDGEALVVLHPGPRLLGLVRDGVEQVVSAPIIAEQLATGDLDGDGCDEIVLWTAERLALVDGTACPRAPRVALGGGPPQAAPAERRPEPAAAVATTEVLGLAIPGFVGPPKDGSGWPRTDVIVGAGWVIGGSLPPVWGQIPSFPAAAIVAESGGPHARLMIGLDSAGFFLWLSDDSGGVHLANLTLGATYGGPDLSIGPFVTAGLINAGGGLRTVWTPWDTYTGSRSGLEARLTWFAPRTGEAMLLYVWRTSMETRSARAREWRDGPLLCRRFGVAIGGAGGFSSTSDSWEFVGSDLEFTASGSPAIAASCESGERIGVLVGLETAPLFSYVTPAEGRRVHHLASHTFGLSFGDDTLRIGPIATAGFWVAGAGARVALTPFETRDGVRHGLELRGTVLWPYGPTVEGLLLYGFRMDPLR